MQDWKVAVLVAIVVVFLVLAALLVFLLYRFGHWRRFTHRKRKVTKTLRYIDDTESNVFRRGLSETESSTDMYQQLFLHDPRLRPSPHILYFLDFQGELMSLDFKKKALHSVKSESGLQRYIYETFHPTIEEGNRVVPVAAETLALSYVNERLALVVMDATRLLERDTEFGARLTHTAERPLLLSRLVADGADGVVYTALARFGYAVGAPPPPPVYSSSGSGGGNYLVTAPVSAPARLDQRQEIVVADAAQTLANPMAQAGYTSPAAAAPPTFSVRSHATPRPAAPHSASLYTLDAPGMAPTPVIHPADTHHITTSTPIAITAAAYTVIHTGGARTAIDVANTSVIEAARLRWDRREALVVTLVSGGLAGYQFVMDPVTDSGNLHPPRVRVAVGAVEPVVCLRADILQYTVERVNSTQWLPVEGPIYLPAGRWCVRARSVLYADDSSKTTAKVFTVNVT